MLAYPVGDPIGGSLQGKQAFSLQGKQVLAYPVGDPIGGSLQGKQAFSHCDSFALPTL